MALTITLDKIAARIGESVIITAGGAVFNTPHNKNVVTFGGVIADILYGTDTELTVTVPQLAESGEVKVETFLDVAVEYQSAIAEDEFTVQYDDDAFPDNVITPDPYHKGYINSRVKTLGTDPSDDARYNRDFSYSNFVEIGDENSMIQNFLSLILTGKLERMWEPDFGSDIPKVPFTLYVNDPNVIRKDIIDEADRLVKEHEPRIELIKSESIVSVDYDNNKINAVFAIKVPSGSIREVGVTLGQVQNETM